MIFVYVSAYGTSSKFLPAVEAEELDDLVDPLKEFGGKRYLQFLHGFTPVEYSVVRDKLTFMNFKHLDNDMCPKSILHKCDKTGFFSGPRRRGKHRSNH